ncbi:BamA/TamA family outer membrane protein, partial [Candidatus Dependentiae bacterium]|nr:BamA/TamA family outer membrane protein [Candidatus Dependentiae bacterium]
MFTYKVACIFFFSFVCAESPKDPQVLSKVTLKGSLVGKDRFLHSYFIEPGDHFDIQKHQHSLEKIKEELIQEGYLAPHVTDQLYPLADGTAIKVVITLDPGYRYTIDAVTFTVTPSDIEKDLTAYISKSLVRSYCTQELLQWSAHSIKEYARARGYIQRKLGYTATKNDKKGTVSLAFQLELDVKKQYSFKGNSFYTTEQLTTEILNFDFKGIPVPSCFLVEDLEAFYKKRGFLHVVVTCHEEADAFSFTIVEGPRAFITAITLTGDESTMKALLVKRCKALYGIYDEDTIKKVLHDCISELHLHGYWDATLIKKGIAQYDEYGSELSLVLTLGEQRTVQDVLIAPYPHLATQKPFSSYVNLSEVRPLSSESLRKQKRYLQEYLRNQGYLYTPVNYSITEREGRKVIEWSMDLTSGPVLFGKTTIVGLSRMKPEVVYRELHYKEGDVWNQHAIEYSLQRLKSLGLFETISLGPEIIGEQVQPLIMKCCEDDPFEVRTRFGFQLVSKSFTHLSWSTYKVGGSFLWKNPTGSADKVGLDLDFTRYTRMVAGTYEVPWIGPVPIRTFFKVYSDRFDQPLLSRPHQRLYKEAHDGASVTFFHSHPWCQSFVRVGLESARVYGISERLAQIIQFDSHLVDKRTPYLYGESSMTVEHFDNKGDPSKGFYTLLSLKAMVPVGIKKGWFVRAFMEQSFFYPLYRSVIGAFRWRCGHIFNAQFSTILPTERFYLGGPTSVRGYEKNMVPPLN